MNRTRRALTTSLLLAASAKWTFVYAEDGPEKITVYKTAGCACCMKWVEHLRAAGFEVEAFNAKSLVAERKRLGVPKELAGCHTATVAGYVVEGHVPADQIRRLLSERPDAVGLSVPGMPVGSPGMEGPGGKDFDVVLFDRAGNASFYATVKPIGG